MLEALIVIAGGQGSRMKEFLPNIPKIMLPLKHGETVLTRLFQETGARRIYLALGFGSDQIQLPKTSGNTQFKVVVEDRPLGTYGALKNLVQKYSDELPEMIPVMLGDLVCSEFDKYQRPGILNAVDTQKNCFFYSKNNHPYDSDLIDLDESGRINFLIKKGDKNDKFINKTLSGIYVLSKADIISSDLVTGDIVHDFLPRLLNKGEVICKQLIGRFHDVGTPDRYIDIVEKEKYLKKRMYVLVDLDGTLIEDRGSSVESANKPIVLKKNCVNILADAQKMGHKIIIITNQGDIAKGFKTEAQFKNSISKIEHELWSEGVWIDDVYHCPHYPISGYPGEIRALKIECDCRKPATGMYELFVEKWNAEPADCLMIGDTEVDKGFATNAGIEYFDIDELEPNSPMMQRLLQRLQS